MKANRCLHCDQMDKEGDILDRDSSLNESPDRVKEGERSRIIGQSPKNGSSTLFLSGNRKKEISFQDGDRRERTGESHAKLRLKKRNRVLGQEDNSAFMRSCKKNPASP